MKKVKFLFMAFVAVAMTLASCSKDEPTTPVVPVDPPEELEEQPVIPAPAAGQVTVAVRIPAGSICKGLVAVGSNGAELSWEPADWKSAEGIAFTPVSETDTWYSITLTHAADMAVKVIAVPETGDTKWDTQWKNIEILDGDAEIEIENGIEPKLNLGATADGTVIFVTIGDWKTAPCAPVIAGGTGTFTFTPACAIPEGSDVTFTGNFDENGWGDSDRVMTAVGDGTYTWTGVYPDGFQMKVFVGDDWMTLDGNVIFDGTNFAFTGGFSFCEAVEVQ